MIAYVKGQKHQVRYRNKSDVKSLSSRLGTNAAPRALPSVSDGGVFLQRGTQSCQLFGQPFHHRVLQLCLMRAVEALEGIRVVQGEHLNTHTHIHTHY